MENHKIKELDIFKDKNFFIERCEDGFCVFYNSVRHFACKITELDLLLFNLIYKYKDIKVILNNIDALYISYVANLYERVKLSNVLNVDLNDKAEIKYQWPTSYYFHLTYKCNLNCVYCYNKDVRKDFKELGENDWFYIIDQVSPFAERIILTGGEPFLSKNIFKIVQYIKNKYPSIYIEIISNCMFDFSVYKNANEIFENIHAVTFSCDNLSNNNQTRKKFDPEVFRKNIIYLKSKYSKLNILISSIFIKGSENELDLIKKFCQETNVGFKSVLVIPNREGEKKMLPSILEYKNTLINIEAKLECLRQFCGAGIGSCSIDPQGNVYPCQSMHYSDFYYGNIFENAFEEILENDRSQTIRTQYSVNKIEVCKDYSGRYICGAGCRAATYKLEGDPMKYPQTLCSYYKEVAIHKLKNIPVNNL